MEQTWQVFDADTPVLTCSYSVGPAVSNALAVSSAGSSYGVCLLRIFVSGDASISRNCGLPKK